MGRLEDILAWKKRWGYDDSAVGPRGQLNLRHDREGKPAESASKALAGMDLGTRPNPNMAAPEELAAKLEELAVKYERLDGDEAHAKALKLRERIRNLRQQPRPPAYDPAHGPLATSLADRIRDRATLDRTAAVDQVTGQIYSTDRRNELVELTGGHYLAKAFGLRPIKQAYRDGAPPGEGILFDHEASSIYQRDDLSPAVARTMEALYEEKRVLNPVLEAYNKNDVFFVNDPHIVAKLDRVYTAEWIEPVRTPREAQVAPGFRYKPAFQFTVEIKPGLHAVVMQGLNDKQADQFKDALLSGTGSTPSAYQVEKVKEKGPARDPLTDPSLRKAGTSNEATLKAVATSPGCHRLAALPDGVPAKQAALAASTMVTGLEKALDKLKNTDKWDAVKDNVLVRNALDKIGRLMQTMPTYTEDMPRFSRLFDLLVDEVYLVLATCKPYGRDDYRQASAQMIDERIPALRDPDMAAVKHHTALLSGGMDCMSTAVSAAFAATGANKLTLLDPGTNHSANYFEVEAHLLGAAVKEGALAAQVGQADDGVPQPYVPPVIMGTLNPSTPIKQLKTGIAVDQPGGSIWTVQTLIDKLTAVLLQHAGHLTEAKPAVAIIDVTVERNAKEDQQEMNRLVAAPAIKAALQAGTLQLMLAKSYQKYPNLGGGKAMSGGLTVMGKGVGDVSKEPLKSMAEAETAKGLLPGQANPEGLKDGYDEAQIVTHFMTHERDAERKMLERAAGNARFACGFLEAGNTLNAKVQFDDGLPFLALPDTFKTKPKRPTAGAGEMKVAKLFHHQGVEDRNSFGFQNTSCLTTTQGAMRVGFGQESEEDLVEKLYAVTTLVSRPVEGGLGMKDVVGQMNGAVLKATAQARTALKRPDEGDADRLKAWRVAANKALRAAGDPLPPLDDDAELKALRAQKPIEEAAVRGEIEASTVERAEKRRDDERALRLRVILGDGQGENEDRLVKELAMAGAAPRLMKRRVQGEHPPDLGEAGMKQWRGESAKALNAVGVRCVPLSERVNEPEDYDSQAEYEKAVTEAQERLDNEMARNLHDHLGQQPSAALAQLGKRMAVLDSLRQPKDVPDVALPHRGDLQPGNKRDAWITQAEKTLRARGVAVPQRALAGDDDGNQHVAALRAALHEADDANLLHAQSAPGWSALAPAKMGLEADYLPNIMASYANLLATGMNEPGQFLPLADVVIDNGLQSLSPEGRERLLQRRVQLSLAGEPADVAADLDQLGKAVKNMPYREGPAKLVLSKDLAVAAHKAGPGPEGDRYLGSLVATLTEPLDPSTQCEVLAQLMEQAGVDLEIAAKQQAAQGEDPAARAVQAKTDAEVNAEEQGDASLKEKRTEKFKNMAHAEFQAEWDHLQRMPNKQTRKINALKADIENRAVALEAQDMAQRKGIRQAKKRIAQQYVLALEKRLEAIKNSYEITDALVEAEAKARAAEAKAKAKADGNANANADARPPRPRTPTQPTPSTPMASGSSLRSGSQAPTGHGPQPMSRKDFNALEKQFNELKAKLQ